MDEITREPTVIRAEDVNPRYNWGRALPAFGTMGVDFEERVDYRRLHRYRLRRPQKGGGESRAGGRLCLRFDNNTDCRVFPCSPAAATIRSSGTSDRRRCITSSTRPGSSRKIARLGSLACAARWPRPLAWM